MPDWIAKASQTLRRAAPPQPVPFELTCRCGSALQGVRRERYQQVICRKCGEALFVLPRDVYPAAVKKSRRRASGKRRSAAPAVPLRRRLAAGVVHAAARCRSAAGWTVRRTTAAAGRVGVRVRSIVTPFRLVLLCIVAAIAATGYYAALSRAREKAELSLKQSLEPGYAALREQRFSEARDLLRQACEALALLGREDRTARQARQKLREATALAGQLDSLEELVADAERTFRDDPAAWERRFQSSYAGRWLIFDGTTTMRMDIGGRAVHIVHDGLPLGGSAGSPGGHEPRFFAAQLASCRREHEPEPHWAIGLNPHTGFAWAHYETLVAAGMLFSDADDAGGYSEAEARAELERQARALEIVE